MQVLKQADVVMLLNLFPYMFSKEVVKKNVLFYEERTIHDSSLSYCAHAQACAAIGETELSWEFFKKCMVIDLDDNPNDTTDGIHAASLGGIWSCVIFGFAGISFSDGRLNVSPAAKTLEGDAFLCEGLWTGNRCENKPPGSSAGKP